VIAQGYPNKPVKLIIPYPPGGPTNLVGRMFGMKLSQIWNQPVIVENKPGAGGNIGAAFVAKAPADGYTLLLIANAHVMNASLSDKLPYDPVRDFTPLSQILQYPLVLVVNPSVTAGTLPELIGLSKKNSLGLASSGSGTSTHLAAELFRNTSQMAFVHVPYKGAGPATADLLAGHVDMMFNDVISALPFVRAGRLRAIATTGLTRSSVFPDVPTVAESGFAGFQATSWFALVGPADLPSDVVRKLNADINSVVQQADTRARFAELGVEPLGTTPDELGHIMQADFEKWARVIRGANIKSN
jgi:tripartite-type tricarboxylate transporter receptor subunit TctC